MKQVKGEIEKMTQLKAIRKHCLWCCGGSALEIKLCPVEECSLWRLRLGKESKGYPQLNAIRRKCLDCGDGTAYDVRTCAHSDCLLFPFRFGKGKTSLPYTAESDVEEVVNV